MTDELVECFNCGRANPEWAQVCRSCGVPLRHGDALVAPPTGPIPTDRESVLSISAAVGTIVVAAVLGAVLSGLNPTEPTVGRSTPTPSPTATPEPSPSESAAPSDTALPSASAAAAPPGTLVFGTELDENDQVVAPVDTFTPGMPFAHSITLPEPFGVSNIGEQVVRINDDGTEVEVQRAIDIQPEVVPDLNIAGFSIPDAGPLIDEWGPGLYEMRVFVANQLVAVGRFTLAEA